MNVVRASDAAALRGLLDAGWSVPQEIVDEVAHVLVEIQHRGDGALGEYVRRYDDQTFELSKLRVPIPMLETAKSLISADISAAIERARERIARFHERQRQPDISYVEEDGTRYGIQRCPLHAVAVYAARSAAPIAVLMGAVPAKIAGVSRVIVLSPPTAGGMTAGVLFACALCGVDELYAAGGAAAVAAAAYGTDSIAPVDKIVGRGGIWTTEAKRQVFGRCGVDVLAGPTDVLIVADDGANSEYVVGELLAQAELPAVTRLAVLSESRSLLEAVAQLIDTLDLRTLDRNEFVTDAILTHCRLIEARSKGELFEVLNRFAPAYLSLQVRDPSAYLHRIYAAGAIFVGDMTPSVSGEYLAGTSRVVPTAGTARFSSSLSLAEFTRSISIVENTKERIESDLGALSSLAEFDGLPHHLQAAGMRCDN